MAKFPMLLSPLALGALFQHMHGGMADDAVDADDPGDHMDDNSSDIDVSVKCPEVIRKPLVQGRMFSPEYFLNCSDGQPSMNARGPNVTFHGEWPGFCENRTDIRMMFYKFPNGLWERCWSTTDCAHIGCGAYCAPHVTHTGEHESRCEPHPETFDRCVNVTEVMVHPEELRACPSDPRDEVCMGVRHDLWAPAGCEIFEAEEFYPSPYAAEIANTCEGFLLQYDNCLQLEFSMSDYAYFLYRLPPPYISDNIHAARHGMNWTGTNGTNGTKKCVMISSMKAERIKAKPCIMGM